MATDSLQLEDFRGNKNLFFTWKNRKKTLKNLRKKKLGFCLQLVGGFSPPLWKIWLQVSWDDYSIPNWMGKQKHVPNHQPALSFFYRLLTSNSSTAGPSRSDEPSQLLVSIWRCCEPGQFMFTNLVGGAMCPSWKMMDFVNGKDDIPFFWENNVWNTTNQYFSMFSNDFPMIFPWFENHQPEIDSWNLAVFFGEPTWLRKKEMRKHGSNPRWFATKKA